MVEVENKVIYHLLQDGTLQFYTRYVDGTLVLIKLSDVQKVMTLLNSFHRNLNFTVDTFEDDVIHFLDIKILNNQTDIYYKETHTGQYSHFSSFIPWRYKVAWVRALSHHSKKICSNVTLFENQIKNISRFLSWNGYPNYVRKSILNRLKAGSCISDKNKNDVIKIYIRPPFAGIKGEQLVKSLLRKMKRFLKPNVSFVVTYDTKKMSYFCNNKDKIHDHQRHNLVYKITCPGCGEDYIGKTDRS